MTLHGETFKTNGCGSSYWLAKPFRIPSWMSPSFTRCCDHHDIAYQKQLDKWDADWDLRNCMYASAYRSPWWQRWIKLWVADLVFFVLQTPLSRLCYNHAKVNARWKSKAKGGK